MQSLLIITYVNKLWHFYRKTIASYLKFKLFSKWVKNVFTLVAKKQKIQTCACDSTGWAIIAGAWKCEAVSKYFLRMYRWFLLATSGGACVLARRYFCISGVKHVCWCIFTRLRFTLTEAKSQYRNIVMLVRGNSMCFSFWCRLSALN